jgi:hypothetical protein
MKNKVGLFVKYLLLGMVITWIILTIGVGVKGSLQAVFSSGNWPLVIVIYLITGLICGACFAAFLMMIRKK